MILTRTKAPQPIAAQPVRQAYTPKTEAEYARLLDALCRKEGKKGAAPDTTQYNSPCLSDDLANKIMQGVKKGVATYGELSEYTGAKASTLQARMNKMRLAGMVTRMGNKWIAK